MKIRERGCKDAQVRGRQKINERRETRDNKMKHHENPKINAKEKVYEEKKRSIWSSRVKKGGRWGPDQHRLLRSLVRTKVASIHPLLRRRASLAYTRRWWGILSIGAQTVAADCILGRDSPVPAPTTVLPLASVLPLIDVGTEPSRMR